MIFFWLLLGLLFDGFFAISKKPTYFPVFWEDNQLLIYHFQGYGMLKNIFLYLNVS